MGRRHLTFVVVCLATLAAAGCGGVRSLNDVLADPAKYRDRSITVHGTVSESASVLGNGAYRITDREQGLWIVTRSGAPRKGARVEVTGRLRDAYDVSAFGRKLPASLQDGLVMVESSHKAR